MKHLTFSTAAILMLFFSFSVSLSAQKTATWKGGKCGNPTDWNCDSNWKEGKAPNEFSQVVIPSGRAFYPVIKDEVPPIDALLIESDAKLTLTEDARLDILNETGMLNGLTLLGTCQNNGVLNIGNDNLYHLGLSPVKKTFCEGEIETPMTKAMKEQ
jgi:hypothetical protein